MPRNFVRRIEVMCPDRGSGSCKPRLLNEVLGTALRDNVKARALQPDGSYVRVRAGRGRRCARQVALLETARASVAAATPPNPNEAAPSFRSVN